MPRRSSWIPRRIWSSFPTWPSVTRTRTGHAPGPRLPTNPPLAGAASPSRCPRSPRRARNSAATDRWWLVAPERGHQLRGLDPVVEGEDGEPVRVAGVSAIDAMARRAATIFQPCMLPERSSTKAMSGQRPGARPQAARPSEEGPSPAAPASLSTTAKWSRSRRRSCKRSRSPGRASARGRPGSVQAVSGSSLVAGARPQVARSDRRGVQVDRDLEAHGMGVARKEHGRRDAGGVGRHVRVRRAAVAHRLAVEGTPGMVRWATTAREAVRWPPPGPPRGVRRVSLDADLVRWEVPREKGERRPAAPPPRSRPDPLRDRLVVLPPRLPALLEEAIDGAACHEELEGGDRGAVRKWEAVGRLEGSRRGC
jgi:hypothetical protein